MEGLHEVGDILTKISVKCVINYMLHSYLCGYFYGFILCVVTIVSIFMGISCICLLLFQYESMHLQNVFFCLHFIYKVLQEFYVFMF
jgi:mannose/fructose/N-acetylgalactosamine-specific phosphotransferase system component IIC